MNLYQLSKEQDELISKMIDEDGVINESYWEEFQANSLALVDKRLGVAAYIMNLKADIEAVKCAISKMGDRFATLVNRKSNLEKYLSDNMEKYGIVEIKCGEFVIQLRENPESTHIDDAFLIPDEFVKVEVKRIPMRTEIKKAIQSGREVEGAHLERTKKLTFK